MITRESIEGLFHSVRSRTKLNIDAPCLWSYFFVDASRDKLTTAGRALEPHGFTVIGFLGSGARGEGEWLRVDRIETHSVDTLLTLNAWLYGLAQHYELESYDGMEVGSAANGVGH